MANDNGSYWKEYLGYPAIAFLMQKGILSYNEKFGESLKEIAWKDINQDFKNDFKKTEEYVLSLVKERGINLDEFNDYIDKTFNRIKEINIKMLGKKKLPPKGY